MSLIQRLKNLWKLSAYRVIDAEKPVLTKSVTTMKKKLATIILPEIDPFDEEIKDA